MNSFSNAKKICICAALIAVSFITSNIKILDMPFGGAVTLCSMLFISLVGFYYGPVWGISAAIVFGAIQFITNPFFLSLPQFMCDYILAFGSLGLSGFFHNQKHGLPIGYIVGVFGRFVFCFLSGVLFFAAYTPKNMLSPVYSLLYNGGYIGVEAIITVILISLPPIKKAITKVKYL